MSAEYNDIPDIIKSATDIAEKATPRLIPVTIRDTWVIGMSLESGVESLDDRETCDDLLTRLADAIPEDLNEEDSEENPALVEMMVLVPLNKNDIDYIGKAALRAPHEITAERAVGFLMNPEELEELRIEGFQAYMSVSNSYIAAGGSVDPQIRATIQQILQEPTR